MSDVRRILRALPETYPPDIYLLEKHIVSWNQGYLATGIANDKMPAEGLKGSKRRQRKSASYCVMHDG